MSNDEMAPIPLDPSEEITDETAFMWSKLAEFGKLIVDIKYGRYGFIDGVALLRERITEALRAVNDDRLVNSYMRTEQLKRVIEDMKEGKTPATIPTGIGHLDTILGGGLRPGAVYIVGGRPGTGKSVLMLQIAENAAHLGKRVLYVSVEMDMLQLSWRTLSRLTDVSMSRFSEDPDSWPQDKVNDAIKAMGLWTILFKDSGAMTTEACRAAAEQAVREMGGLDLVVVDYLHIMTDTYGGGNENARVGFISRELRNMARDLEVPLLVGAQLNRNNDREKRRPTLKDLRDSGTLEADASVVMAIHPHYDPEKEEDKPPMLATDLILLKNRFGRAGVHVACNFDQPHQLFKMYDSQDASRYDPSGVAYAELQAIAWDPEEV